jgi:ATP-binding cassette subfamily B multidrug efflux pump
MIRLAKYLKPYLGMILLAIVLLFAQANLDLALPDYLSRIVDVGIQQSGVENAVPAALRQSTMDKILLLTSAQNQEAVLEVYTLVDQDSPQYQTLSQHYPLLEDEPIYVLEDVDHAGIERLNPVMAKAILAVSAIEQVMSDPSRIADLAGGLPLDPGMITPGTDLFALLSQQPVAQRERVVDAISQHLEALGASAIVQAAAGPIVAEYEALGIDTAQLRSDYIIRAGGAMLLLTLLAGGCTVAVGYLAAKVAASVARDIRRELFRKVESFSHAEFDSFSTASLITRTTNDVMQIQRVVMMMRLAFFAPLMGVGGIIRAIGKAESLWWLIGVAVLTLVSLVLTIASAALPKFKAMQRLIDRLNLVAREGLSGMMVVRAFNRQPREEQRFDKVNLELTDVSLFVHRVMVVMMPFMMLVMNGLGIAILWVGGQQVAQSSIQVGDIMAFIQYAMHIVMSFLMLTMLFVFLPRAAVSADRVAEVLDTEPSIRDPEQPLQFPPEPRGRIEFRGVSFRYPNAPEEVLHDITLTAHPGEAIGIIGPTGCGKSTLVNLIPRFYDVTEGELLVDGVDVRRVTQRDLRDRIGYIPQVGTLFSGTIGSNLLYADEDASKESIREALDVAQASEFVFDSPEGLEAPIAQRGDNVSGGQKQRLSIARALVKKPPIYIFDDSFSALDFKTELALRQALNEGTAHSTALFVTQRVSTVKSADRIIVLDEGRICGKGTHDELMDTCPCYREIALSQMSAEELA